MELKLWLGGNVVNSSFGGEHGFETPESVVIAIVLYPWSFATERLDTFLCIRHDHNPTTAVLIATRIPIGGEFRSGNLGFYKTDSQP